jgi:tetratricopeptide (TPR) repeat protein
VSKRASAEGQRSSQHPSRSELRASIVWPVVIAVGIWLAGLIVWIIAPGRFDAAVSAVVALGLVVYLVWYQRSLRLTPSERIFSLLLAVPAVAGITAGAVQGQAVYAITGVSLSLLLLAAQRAFTVPLSYRAARRHFAHGRLEAALDLVDKAIVARPGFWESYQLRALIYLSGMQFPQAERDALKALELRPDAHPVHNTLGQLYLANSDYARAADAYSKAIDLSPKHALYSYHQGLALYRLGRARDAAEALAAATRLGLPDVTYELQAYYYLGRALENNGEIEKAEEVFADMVKFKEGLNLLQSELSHQPNFPELPALRADLRDLDKRLLAANREATDQP